jgi:hypothetical protein
MRQGKRSIVAAGPGASVYKRIFFLRKRYRVRSGFLRLLWFVKPGERRNRMNNAGNRLTLDMTLARHCAPVLMGKKPAALFPRPSCWDEALTERPVAGNARFLLFERRDKNALVFAYSPRLLAAVLNAPLVRRTLTALGYPLEAEPAALTAAESVAPSLAFLGRRFWENVGFPHEVGFFLGYPPADVLGFMRHRGSRCKLRGMWQVYGDAARAAVLFAEYARCRDLLVKHVQNGGTILRGRSSAAIAAAIAG